MTGIYLVSLAVLSVSITASGIQKEPGTSWLRHCETDTPIPEVGQQEGVIPEWIKGRLIRVGPGIQHIGNTSYKHLFDPLAILHQVEIKDGTATYISKFLESETYKTNMREQRIAITEFGTAAFPDPCKTLFERFSSWFDVSIPDMGDNCLVNVLQATDQFIAMTETDTVRVVDPNNLHVIGEGVKLADYVPIQRATAHPHVEKDGTIYNIAFSITSQGPGYSIISHKNGRVEEANLEATVLARWRFNPAYMHSFAITENYYVIIETPLALNAPTMMTSKYFGLAPEEGIIWYPGEKSRFRVIERSTGEEVDIEYESDAFFTFHHINAYETNGLLVVDVCAIASGEIIKALYFENLRKSDSDPTKFKFDSLATRFVLPLTATKELPFDEELLTVPEVNIVPENPQDSTRAPSAKRVEENKIYLKGVTMNDKFLEMPRINYEYNEQQYRYVYGVGTQTKSLDFSSIIKLDVRTGRELVWQDNNYFVSEPIFVAEPDGADEDSGVILTLLLHKEELKHAVLLILDAHDLREIARTHFNIQGTVTPTFHGQFISFAEAVHGY